MPTKKQELTGRLEVAVMSAKTLQLTAVKLEQACRKLIVAIELFDVCVQNTLLNHAKRQDDDSNR